MIEYGNTLGGSLGSAIAGLGQMLADTVNTLGKTGMAVGAFLAMFFDNTIPGTDEERGLTAWKSVADTVEAGQ